MAMIYVFYNKILLRFLVALTGISVGLVTWKYVALSAEKLPDQGGRDALAIVSFLIAGWLVMLIAEVIDQHYVRAFAALCVMLGGYVSHKWIFQIDGPKLISLPSGGSGMQMIYLGFWGAIGCAVLMLAILIGRLVLDKSNYGRRPYSPANAEAALATQAAGQVQALQASSAKAGELAPIPVDTSPIAVSSSAAATPTVTPTAVPARAVAPIKRLSGIGGVYLGRTFDITPGEHSVGRQDAAILLTDDNQVSRSHASLSVDEAGIATVHDNGSTNGTFVNDIRIDTMQLAPGDTLRFGTSLFRVEG